MALTVTSNVASSPLADMFRRLDADGDGSITHSELENFSGAASGDSWGSIAVANTLMESFDADRNGKVNADEFKVGMKKAVFEYFSTAQKAPSDAELPSSTGEWFVRADADGDGVVTEAEMEPILQQRLVEVGGVSPRWPGLPRAAKLLGTMLTPMLDRDGSGGIDRSELDDLVSEVVS